MAIKEVLLEICYVQATPEEMLKRERAFDLLAAVIAKKMLEGLAQEGSEELGAGDRAAGGVTPS